MLIQYGSVLCIACASLMRLAIIEPDKPGTSRVMFECRYQPCGKSRVLALGRSPLQRDVRGRRGGGRSSRGGGINGVGFDEDGPRAGGDEAVLVGGDVVYRVGCGGAFVNLDRAHYGAVDVGRGGAILCVTDVDLG